MNCKVNRRSQTAHVNIFGTKCRTTIFISCLNKLGGDWTSPSLTNTPFSGAFTFVRSVPWAVNESPAKLVRRSLSWKPYAWWKNQIVQQLKLPCNLASGAINSINGKSRWIKREMFLCLNEEDKSELLTLKQEVNGLEEENEILKKVAVLFAN